MEKLITKHVICFYCYFIVLAYSVYVYSIYTVNNDFYCQYTSTGGRNNVARYAVVLKNKAR